MGAGILKVKIRARAVPRDVKAQTLEVTRTPRPTRDQQIINIWLFNGTNQTEEVSECAGKADG